MPHFFKKQLPFINNTKLLSNFLSEHFAFSLKKVFNTFFVINGFCTILLRGPTWQCSTGKSSQKDMIWVNWLHYDSSLWKDPAIRNFHGREIKGSQDIIYSKAIKI